MAAAIRVGLGFPTLQISLQDLHRSSDTLSLSRRRFEWMQIQSEGNLGRKKIWKRAFEAEHATLDPRVGRGPFEWNQDTQAQVDEEEHRWSSVSQQYPQLKVKNR